MATLGELINHQVYLEKSYNVRSKVMRMQREHLRGYDSVPTISGSLISASEAMGAIIIQARYDKHTSKVKTLLETADGTKRWVEDLIEEDFNAIAERQLGGSLNITVDTN